MMATTHALAGVAVASLVALGAPEQVDVALAAAFVGGLFPDLDLYAGHRKTLHFPVYYWPFALAAGALAIVSTGPATVALACFLLAAALHSTMDVFGGGLELRPWLATSERAVYDHFAGRWRRPRRWVRYDGAPEDALLGALLAVPPLLVAGAPLRWLIGATVCLSVGYALVRRRVPAVTEHLVGFVPATMTEYVPERFVEG
ncbi:metal-dependent hydrolase [Halococcus dombrowskii]|uniref:Metal-dependent hydrolase n=1 Tax=Halococcus dombrowskii TaxID=179637 RepID=A0AAV3SGJ1_HALDO|nr:metal-dependent hydrolase [Halococcus dombrowskii]UOO93872.1 metal-dependent hydrolase [Halococcus dombrowskii]